MNTYVPTWPGLRARDLSGEPAPLGDQPFPFAQSPLAFYYRERNALYHLFRALRRDDADWALVPDYHHGNEVKAIRATGFDVRFYPVGRDMTANLDALLALCEERPRVLLLIHYLGWPQPLDDILAACRRLEIVTVEDCALSLLSADGDVALGSRADHALFCLYKTLPVPNGGLLVHNRTDNRCTVAQATASCGLTSLTARALDLTIDGMRGRGSSMGATLATLKAKVGAALTRQGIRRWPVGDDGFDEGSVDLRMSRLSEHLLHRFDYADIRERRRENFSTLRRLLRDDVTPVRDDLPAGMCPLFFPLLVPDKRAAARALWARGIGAVEFWNTGDPGAAGPGATDADFLRTHVLELPIHQDLRPAQLEYMASAVRALGLRGRS